MQEIIFIVNGTEYTKYENIGCRKRSGCKISLTESQATSNAEYNKNVYFSFSWLVIARAVLVTHDARLIAIFPTGNDIDSKHRIMIVILNIFFKF